LTQCPSGEFQGCCLALEKPCVTVRIEDPITQKIMKDSMPRGAFGVVVEAGLQYVLQVPRVAGHSHQTLLFGEEGDCTDASLVRAATRA